MVPVDNVYRTVLNILNKENRGYVTPAEFNTLAKQAQTEIFENYFTTQYRVQQGPMSAGDYSDITKNIEEKITFFDNTFQPAIAENLGGANNVSPYLGFAYPPDFYRLGRVQVEDASGLPTIVDEVSHEELAYVRRSPLTSPTATQPVYVRHQGGVRIFPQTIPNTDVEIIYVRQPAIPMWVGATTGGQLIANTTATDYQNFELHASEEPELVAKILAYSGVIVRAADVTQAAAAKEQQIGQDNG